MASPRLHFISPPRLSLILQTLVSDCRLITAPPGTSLCLSMAAPVARFGRRLLSGQLCRPQPRAGHRQHGRPAAIPLTVNLKKWRRFNYQLESEPTFLANFQTVQSVNSDLNGIADLLEDIVPAGGQATFFGTPVVILPPHPYQRPNNLTWAVRASVISCHGQQIRQAP